jgi:SNF2 family DNA or RNA helicase
MAENSFYAVILDEAQNIKNAKTKRSKNLTMLKSDFRLALSGTPIENNLMELWSIFHFLMP